MLAVLRRVNQGVALACGAALLATVAFVLVEVAMRAAGLGSLGGSDEVAGYVLAGVAAWGLPFALTEGAHIRIDVAVRRAPPAWRDAIDVAALGSVAAVAVTVAIHGLGVLATSLAGGSTANTPLETPLWIPQAVWWVGWVWFAVTACLLTGAALALALRRRSDELRALAGFDEGAGG